MLPSGKHAKNAHSISLPSLRQHYLVAMAKSLGKLENKVQIHHRHVKRFHMVKRLRKSVQYIQRYSTKYSELVCVCVFVCTGILIWFEPRREHATQFPLGCSPPKLPIFTKILHDIVASVALLNHAYTRRYPISFLNARAAIVQSLPFFPQNRLPWQRPLRYRKKAQIDHVHPKCFHSVKRLQKSVQQILR